ncbi:hypothetical protein AVEN_12592-1 [Araneus ventricosus]|uniref:Uncharacterized protein n=1 Tax=Araneus ventricosus TaxID=182803 RepID=A0A4Y2ACC0_ARAVE|nr:hypothetical protein AVEN_12592-1 [Araneus ventricosus]
MQLSCSVVQDMAEVKMSSPVASSPSPPVSGHFDDMEDLSHSPSPLYRGPNDHLSPPRGPEKYYGSNVSKSCISFSVDYLLADKNRTFRRSPSPPTRRPVEQLPKRFTVDGILDSAEDSKRLPVTGTVCAGLGSRPIALQSQAATVPIAAPCWAHPLGSAFPWLQGSRSLSPPNTMSKGVRPLMKETKEDATCMQMKKHQTLSRQIRKFRRYIPVLTKSNLYYIHVIETAFRSSSAAEIGAPLRPMCCDPAVRKVV